MKVAPLVTNMHFHAQKADRPAFRHVVHGGKLHFGRIDHGDGARTLDVHGVVGLDESRGILVQTDADGEGVVRERREQPAEPVALPEVLVDDESIGEPEAGRESHRPCHGGAPLVAEGNHVLTEECGARTGAGYWNAAGVQLPHRLRHRRASDQGGKPELVAAGEENPGRPIQALEAARLLGIASGIEVQRAGAACAHFAKNAFVPRSRVAHQAGGRDDGDVRRAAARQIDEAPQNLRRVFLLLGTSDRDDPTPPPAFRHLTCAHSFTVPDFWSRDHATRHRGWLTSLWRWFGRRTGAISYTGHRRNSTTPLL